MRMSSAFRWSQIVTDVVSCLLDLSAQDGGVAFEECLEDAGRGDGHRLTRCPPLERKQRSRIRNVERMPRVAVLRNSQREPGNLPMVEQLQHGQVLVQVRSVRPPGADDGALADLERASDPAHVLRADGV